jgi:hypothetical protein
MTSRPTGSRNYLKKEPKRRKFLAITVLALRGLVT